MSNLPAGYDPGNTDPGQGGTGQAVPGGDPVQPLPLSPSVPGRGPIGGAVLDTFVHGMAVRFPDGPVHGRMGGSRREAASVWPGAWVAWAA